MGFHRYKAPPTDYIITGGGSLPTGYDYINNDPAVTEGTASTTPSYTEAAKATGTNSGTYFLGWMEDAVSRSVNRGFRALAENTDYLDEMLRRRMGIPTIASVTVTGGLTYHQLSGWVWCGDGTITSARRLVSVVNLGSVTYEDAFAPAGGSAYAWFYPTDIRDSAGAGSVIGTGWVNNPRVYFNFAPSTNFPCLIIYAARGSLQDAWAGALIDAVPRRSVVDGGVQQKFVDLMGGTIERWTETAISTIDGLARRGLDDAYRRKPVGVGTTNVAGGGAVITRDGISPTSRSTLATRTFPDPFLASWTADLQDTGLIAGTVARLNTQFGSNGFVALGSQWRVRKDQDITPSFTTFMSLLTHKGDTDSTSTGGYAQYTFVPDNCTGTIVALGGTKDFFVVQLDGTGTYPDPYFWKDMGGSVHRTSVVLKKDFLEFTISGTKRVFVIVALVDDGSGGANRKAIVCPWDSGLDSSMALTSTAITGVKWYSTQMYLGQGAPATKIDLDAVSAPSGVNFTGFDFNGMFLAFPPLMTDNQGDDTDEFYNPALTSSALLTLGVDSSTRYALTWGAYNYDPDIASYETGSWGLLGDGSVVANHGSYLGRVTGVGYRYLNQVASNVSGALATLTINIGSADTHVYTATGSFSVSQILINTTNFTRDARAKIIMNGYSGPIKLTTGGPGWTVEGSGGGGGVATRIIFPSYADRFPSNETKVVDVWDVINIGSDSNPELVVTVSRMRPHAFP